MLDGIDKYLVPMLVKRVANGTDEFGNTIEVLSDVGYINGRIRQLSSKEIESGKDVDVANYRLYTRSEVLINDYIQYDGVMYRVVGFPNDVMWFGELWQVELWRK